MRGKAPNTKRGIATLRQSRVARQTLPDAGPNLDRVETWEPTWFSMDVDECMCSVNVDHDNKMLKLDLDLKYFNGPREELYEYLTEAKDHYTRLGNLDQAELFSQLGFNYKINFNQKLGLTSDETFWNAGTAIMDAQRELEMFLHGLLNFKPTSEASRNLRQRLYSTVYEAMVEFDYPSNLGDRTNLSSYDYADLLDAQVWMKRHKRIDTQDLDTSADLEMAEYLCDPDPLLRRSGSLGLYLAYRDGQIFLEDEEYGRTEKVLAYLLQDEMASRYLKKYDTRLFGDLLALQKRIFSE